MEEKQFGMDMYYPQRGNDTVTIDIRNLLGHILLKWKMILAVSLVCAVLGGLAGFVLGGRNKAAEEADGLSKAESIAKNLSEVQRDEAERYYTQIASYDRMIDEQKRFNEESFIMNLDPATAVGCSFQYLLETDMGNVSSAYMNVLSEEDYARISEALTSYKGKRGLNDAVQIVADEEVMDTYNMDLVRSDRLSGQINNKYICLLNVTVIAPDKEACDRITDIADAAFKKKTDILAEYGSETTCRLISDKMYDPNVEYRIIQLKQKNINTLGTMTTNRGNFVNNVVAKADKNEIAYIEVLRSTLDDRSTTNTPVNKVSIKRIIKYAFAGLLAGFFLYICLIVIVYMVNGKLHTASDIMNNVGIPVLQILTPGYAEENRIKDNRIFKLARKIVGREGNDKDVLLTLFEEINKKAEKGAGPLYIAVDMSSEIAKEYARKILESAKNNTSYCVGNIVPNPDDMRQLLESDGVLIVPVIDKTDMNEIYTFIDICRRNNLLIIGSVPIGML